MSPPEEQALPQPARLFQAIAAVATHRSATKGDLAVMAVILTRYNASTGVAWPGINRIAKEGCIDRATVLRAVQHLEAMGCIVVNRSQRGRSNRYTPTFKASFMDATSSTHATSSSSDTGSASDTSRSDATPPVALVPPQVVAAVQPELLYRTSPRNVSSFIEQQAARSPAKRTDRFDEFWAAYPVKKGRANALKTWAAKKLDAIADKIIADVKQRVVADRQWLDGYAPHGSTYINRRGWEDAIEPVRSAAAQRVIPADFKPRANDDFKGKQYAGTPIAHLSPEIRAAVEASMEKSHVA
jgi:hypothetical protein